MYRMFKPKPIRITQYVVDNDKTFEYKQQYIDNIGHNVVLDACIPRSFCSYEVKAAIDNSFEEFDIDKAGGLYFWNDNFTKVLADRLIKLDNNKEIYESVIRTNQYYPSQGDTPACSSYAQSGAALSSYVFLNNFDSSIKIPEFNPIVPFAYSRKGDVYGGGQLLDVIAGVYTDYGCCFADSYGKADKTITKPSQSTLSHYPNDTKCKETQNICVQIETDIVERTFQAVKAGFSVVFGSSYCVPTKARIDSNGLRVPILSGRGGHSTHFGAGLYKVVNGTEYIGWINSWGSSMYNVPDSSGLTTCGCWCDKSTVKYFYNDQMMYGTPYAVSCEFNAENKWLF